MFGVPVISAGLISFILCIIFIPFIIKLSEKNLWFDDINHRKIHKGNISRLAGVAIFFSMAIAIVPGFLFLYSKHGINISFYKIVMFFAAFLLVFIVGLIDDFKTIMPKFKFIAQIISAALIVLSGGFFSVLHIPFTDYSIDTGIFGYILTLVWIIGASNAVNLIDGMDGLSGGLTAIAALFLCIISIALENYLTALISFAIFGSLIGFLVFNFPPAKIFMGDAGALFLGLALSSLPLLEIENGSTRAFIIAVSVIFIPVMDTLTSMIRRISRKQSPFYPDREHIHHKLMDRGLSVKQILFSLYSVSIILCILVFLWAALNKIVFINMVFILWIAIIIITLLLEKHHADNR